MYTYTCTCIIQRVRGMRVCDRFHRPRHVGSRTLSSEDKVRLPTFGVTDRVVEILRTLGVAIERQYILQDQDTKK